MKTRLIKKVLSVALTGAMVLGSGSSVMAMDAADVLSAQDDTAENYETVAEDTVGEFVSEEADTDSEETDPESTEPFGELENNGEEISAEDFDNAGDPDSAEDLTISDASQDTEEELEIQEENNLNEDDELSMDESMDGQADSDFDSGEEVKAAGAGTITEEGTYGDLNWTLDDKGCVTITGSGRISADDVSYESRQPWYNIKETITSAVVKAKVIGSAEQMFDFCPELESVDLKNADFSETTSLNRFFAADDKLKTADLSMLDTSNVTDMAGMFSGCNGLQSVNVRGMNTARVTDMSGMFYGCSGLWNLDVTGFNTLNVTDMAGMFNECSNLISLDVSNFDTSKVTDMSYMFWGCENLTSLDLSRFLTSKVTDMSYMFRGCRSLQSLRMDKFDTSRVTEIVSMFSTCPNLQSLDVSKFNTSNVEDMAYMFNGCSALQSLDVSGFDTSNARHFEHMFANCSSLQNLDVSGFDTSKATNISYMFAHCEKLQNLDVSKFKTSNLQSGGAEDLFMECTNLRYLDLSSMDFSNYHAPVASIHLFSGKYPKLTKIRTTKNPLSSIELPTEMGRWEDAKGNFYSSITPDMGEVITLTRNLTIRYKVSFNANGGTVSVSGKTVTDGKTYEALPTPVRAGYNFAGWYTEKSGGTKITAGTTVDLVAPQTLYAHWTKKVANKSIKKASISVKDVTYNGGSVTPSVTVKYGKTTLKKGYDYTITCSNNINVGNSAKVSIKGMGDYKDTVTRTFKIKKCSMSSVKATIPYGNVVWNGWAQKPGFTLYLQRSKTSKYTLKKGTDYTFTYKNNKEPGKASIIVKGKGNFCYENEYKFTIVKAAQPARTNITTLNKKYTKKNQSYTLRVTGVKEHARVSYASSNTNVAYVKPGKIVVCGRGTATITVYMAATKHYRETTKTIRINIS